MDEQTPGSVIRPEQSEGLSRAGNESYPGDSPAAPNTGKGVSLSQVRGRALIALCALVGVFLAYALAQPFIPALSVPPVMGTRIAYTVVFFALAWTMEPLERAVWATVVFFVATLVVRVGIQALLNSGIGFLRGWHTSEVLLDYSYPACLLAAAAVWVSLKGKRG